MKWEPSFYLGFAFSCLINAYLLYRNPDGVTSSSELIVGGMVLVGLLIWWLFANFKVTRKIERKL